MTDLQRSRRRLLLAAASTLALSPALTARAASLPDGPIKILVGFPAGGTIDVVTRQVADAMREDLGVPVVVENVTGAGGQLAAQALKRAAADGRTLMVAPDHTAVIVPLTVAQPGFSMAADFVPVGQLANYEGALAVSAASGVKDVAGLLAAARQNPAAGTVGIPAAGSKPQFLVAGLARQHQLPLTTVPYRGSAPLVQDLAGGHLAAGITALGDFLEFHRAGKLRVVAMVGQKRSPLLPEVPTLGELGYPMAIDFWIGLFAPAKTPRPALDRLAQSLDKALASTKVRERMAGLVFEPIGAPSARLAARIEAETRQMEPLISGAGWVKQ